jgi:ion channel-forming bestrophin family protein
MFVNKNFEVMRVLRFAGVHLIWLTLWATLATGIIELIHWYTGDDKFGIPWLPVSVIGTAVAFYVGFKNNSAYDRLWEARKIWGAIVNDSRKWSTSVISFCTNQFAEENIKEEEIESYRKQLIYRHIGWLYALRSQLLIPTPWEHINQGRMMKKTTEARFNTWGVGLFNDEVTNIELKHYLPAAEIDRLVNSKNTATQIIHAQSQELKLMREKGIVEDFRHMELQNILNEFYTHQGQAERIKKFPLPRQYGNGSQIFIGIFIFLLPFSMVSVFHELTAWGGWLSIPFSVLVGWVFVFMELIGDYSENPFEGLGNDIPMLSLCRTIEIDLKEMLGETDLPPAIEAKDGVLM